MSARPGSARPASYRIGGSLVVDPGGGRDLVLLNETAGFIWELAVEGRTLRHVARELAAAYGLGEAEALQHARTAIEGFERVGLLTREALAAPREVPRARPPDPGCPSITRIYDLCGVPIAVTFAPPGLERLIGARFGYAEAPDARPEHALELRATPDGYAVLSDGAPVAEAASEQTIIGELIGRYVELSHGRSDWLAVLHAAAVRSPGGAGIVLPGTNGRGKSTLVAGLLARGYGYCSDDCVPVDPLGRIHPVPFAICLKRGSWHVAGAFSDAVEGAQVQVNQAGIECRYFAPVGTVRAPGPLRAFVFPAYREGGTRLTGLKPDDALKAIMSAKTWISRDPADMTRFLALVERVPAFALDYGSVESVLDGLAEIESRVGAT